MNSHFALCFGVAASSRGNHVSGTLTVLPSASVTLSASSEHETSTATASPLSAKILIPSLQEHFGVRADDFLDGVQLVISKPSVARQLHRIKPKLGVASCM